VDADLRAQLPSQLQQAVDDAEQSCGGLILVERPPTGVPGVYIDETAARIILPLNVESVAVSLSHEVLHIERFWSRRSPQLIGNRSILALDNQLEHLLMVPELQELGMVDLPRLGRELTMSARRLTEGGDDESSALWASVIWTLVCRFLRTEFGFEEIRDAVVQAGLIEAAQGFEARLANPVPSKEYLLCHLLDEFPFLVDEAASGLSISPPRVRRLLVAEGRAEIVELLDFRTRVCSGVHAQ
jgi:hypothetical protein